MKRLSYHVSAQSLISQQKAFFINQLHLDGVNSYWNICHTTKDFRICKKKTPNQQKVLKLTLSFGDIYTIKQKHPIQQLKESFDS